MSENEKIAREILEATCETDEIFEDYDLDLIDEGFIDSFAVLNVIIQIEEKTGVKLQISDITKENISSVNRLIKFLDQLK